MPSNILRLSNFSCTINKSLHRQINSNILHDMGCSTGFKLNVRFLLLHVPNAIRWGGQIATFALVAQQCCKLAFHELQENFVHHLLIDHEYSLPYKNVWELLNANIKYFFQMHLMSNQYIVSGITLGTLFICKLYT